MFWLFLLNLTKRSHVVVYMCISDTEALPTPMPAVWCDISQALHCPWAWMWMWQADGCQYNLFNFEIHLFSEQVCTGHTPLCSAELCHRGRVSSLVLSQALDLYSSLLLTMTVAALQHFSQDIFPPSSLDFARGWNEALLLSKARA